MKAILLAGAASLMTVMSYAQPELTANTVFDDFSTVDEHTADAGIGRGLYWWGQNGVHTMNRNATENKLEIEMAVAAHQYAPFGVGFGDSNGADPGGTPYTINISQDGSFSFDIENTGSESLSLRVACIDNQDRSIDSDAGVTTWNTVWSYQIQVIVPAGGSTTFMAGSPNGAGGDHLNSGSFENGSWAFYSNDPLTNHTIRRDCDLTKIKGVNITVLNGEKKPADGHALALTDGKFNISNFRVGNAATVAGINLFDSENQGFSVYPNPVTDGIINLNEEMNDIAIYNSQGVLSKSFDKTDVINVSDLSDGFYTIKTDKGYSKFIIE